MKNQPISPSALRPLNDEHLDELIGKTNARLQDGHLTRYGGKNIAADLISVPEHLRDAFIRAYVSAGWRVVYVPDQRDGDYWSFSER